MKNLTGEYILDKINAQVSKLMTNHHNYGREFSAVAVLTSVIAKIILVLYYRSIIKLEDVNLILED